MVDDDDEKNQKQQLTITEPCESGSEPGTGNAKITMRPPSLGASLVIQPVKNLTAMQETWVQSLGWEDPLEEGMVTPWQPIENPHGQRSLEGYSPWDCKELDTTEELSTAQGEGKCSPGPPFTSPLTSLPSPRPQLNHMLIHETASGSHDGTSVKQSKMEG